MLSEEDNYILASALDILLTDFEPREAVLFMASKSVFTSYQQDSILAKADRAAQIHEFLRQYRRSAQNLSDLALFFAYYGQPHISNILTNRSTLTDFSRMKNDIAHELIKFSSIPGSIPKNVFRAELVEQLQNDLLQMKNLESFWYVVHGPAGSGKTCLVADTLRSSLYLLEQYTGVVWLHDGRVSPDQLPALYADFYVFLSDSIELASGSAILYSQEQIRNLLKEKKNLLVVLDDLVLMECFRWFDNLKCRILVTTRDLEITQVTTMTKKVFSLNNFSQEEFKSYVLLFDENLSVDLISKFYATVDGNPAMTSIAMNLFGEDPKKLEWFCNNFGKEKYPLKSFSYITPYTYRNMYDSIMRSYKRLDKLQRDVLRSFLIFPPGTWIDCRAISPIVSVDLIDKELSNRHWPSDYLIQEAQRTLKKLSLIAGRIHSNQEQYRLPLLMMMVLLDNNEHNGFEYEDFVQTYSYQVGSFNLDSYPKAACDQCFINLHERWSCFFDHIMKSRKSVGAIDEKECRSSKKRKKWGEICIFM